MKFNQFGKKLFLMTAIFCGLFGANSLDAFAQFAFNGDYDRNNFAAPRGYYTDPQIQTPNGLAYTFFTSGTVAENGSVIALGGYNAAGTGVYDFYLKKFTSTGALDNSFGNAGTVQTNIQSGTNFADSIDSATVIKRQPDGKLIAAGSCVFNIEIPFNGGYGRDVCAVRYNADGSIDGSFGNTSVPFQFCSASGCTSNNFLSGNGKVIIGTGGDHPFNSIYGSGTGAVYDMAIQPDGKIIMVGGTRTDATSGSPEGFILRLNANGSLDTSFGLNNRGINWFAGVNTSTNGTPCFTLRRLSGVALQSDGRIIAVGYDGVNNSGCSARGTVFAISRWSGNGLLETVKRLDNSTDASATESAYAVLNAPGNKVIVSGQYQNSPTLVKFDSNNLTLDSTFGTNGIVSYRPGAGNRPLKITALQPDGKILGIDDAGTNNIEGPVRFNPNGSPDQSFGNLSAQLNNIGLGRLGLNAMTYDGNNPRIGVGSVLVQPNGKINLIGNVPIFNGNTGAQVAFASQNYNVSRPNITSDFTNDGKADIAVFRSGNWYYLNSATNQFSGATFGQSGDKPAPADFDGDGKTDLAVYRPSVGYWYILQSSNNQFRAVQFGASEDLPRPGDFDGDGQADIAVFRPSNGSWYYLRSSDNQFRGVAFGQSGDVPLLADFDGDGKSDIAVFRPSNGAWYYLQSSDGSFRGVSFGFGSDIPTVGDYDGDGKSDVSVFRPSNGYWYRLNSSNGGFAAVQFGQNGDKPVAADYDNDGKTDLAIFRNGSWYGLRSTDNSVFGVAFGASTDTPIPAAYLP